MSDNFKKCVVIKNQTGHSFSFYLNKLGDIKYDCFKENNQLISEKKLVEGNALEFCASIDRFDTIHLIFLNCIGELKHLTYINNSWKSKVISNLDLLSNNYKHLKLIIFDDSIGLLYSYANLISPCVWNIDYISITSNYQKQNIISFLTNRDFYPYSICIDKFNDIHLLYTATECGYSQIYYMKFSPFLNVYKKPPLKISNNKTNNFNPYIFIDTHNQIHTLWSQVSFESSDIKYMVVREHESKFEAVILPTLKNDSNYPIIFEEHELLKIVYISNNSINMISSKDFSLNWLQNASVDILDNALYLFQYISNYSQGKNIDNINYVYGFIDENIKILFSNSFKNNFLELDLQEDTIDNTIIDFESNLSVNSIDSNYIDDAIDNTSHVLSDFLIKIDNSLIYRDSYSKSIERVELKLSEYNDKNRYLIELLNSLNNYHKENSKTISKLEDDLNYLKENLDKQNHSFLKSLFSKFK